MRDPATNPVRSVLIGMAVLVLCWPGWAQDGDQLKQGHRTGLPRAADVTVNFSEHIQPILEKSCLRCHGAERPKGKFSLTSREAALKGGANGAAIFPGDSGNSPLIHYVVHIVEDMEMPPIGKGEPLLPEEISLLRAWIDQGVTWGEQVAIAPKFSVAPSFRWTGVSGDKGKFREHFWTREGFNPGVEEFSVRQPVGEASTVTMEGHAFPLNDEYLVTLSYDRPEVGFVRGGFKHFRKYFDASGGYYSAFPQPLFEVDRDLHMDIGKAWAEAGLTLPGVPRAVLGYEYHFRQGVKSTLQWGEVRTTSAPVFPDTGTGRNIYPAFKDVDEKLHVLRLDVSQEIAGFGIADNLRAEFYDLKTERENALSLTLPNTQPTRAESINEAHEEFRLANTLRLEKEIRDWWFVAGGYLYSRAEADAMFDQATFHATGLPIAGDFWKSQSLVFDQSAHVFSANTRFGPWQYVTLSAGVQSEWTHQEGVGRVSMDSGNPATFLLVEPATLDANLDKHSLQEQVAVRFTGIRYTSLFAEGRLRQDEIGQFEEQVGGHHEFLRDTDAQVDAREFRIGAYTAPFRQASFGGHYRHQNRGTDYEHEVDFAGGVPNDSYSAFIRHRRIETDEVEAKVTVRPVSWLKVSPSYQHVRTDFRTSTDAIPGVSPGGALDAADLDADVFGVNAVMTPFRKWYFSGTFNYFDSRMEASRNGVASVVPYRGDVFHLLTSATFMLNDVTDLVATYSFSSADYAQDNEAEGLPLGICYDLHGLEAGVTRRFKHFTAQLKYGFFDYNEPSSAGANDYTAHALFATMSLRWR